MNAGGRFLGLLLIALCGTAILACGDTKPSGPPPRLMSVEAEREVGDDGAARRSTTIKVRFDRDFVLVSERLPLASYFEVGIEDEKGSSRRVLVRTAAFDGNSRRNITLKLDDLIPDGAILKVAKRAVTRNAEGNLELKVKSDMSYLDVLLASTPLTFQASSVLGEPKQLAVTDADRDPAAMRKALEAHFDARRSPPELKNTGLAAYDNLPADVVPSPKLRAALAALMGTFAEPALASLFTTSNCTQKAAALIAFQPPPDYPDLLARATTMRDGRRVISVNPRIEGEPIEALMPLLAHEAIHCDNRGSISEEVAATAFDTFFYIEIISAFPNLPASGSILVREFNANALAMVNSGRRYPESVGILRSAGFQFALPGTTATFASFGDLVAAAYAQVGELESPEEPLARQYVVALAARTGAPLKSAFDLRYLDDLLGRSMDIRVLTAALEILQLAPA